MRPPPRSRALDLALLLGPALALVAVMLPRTRFGSSIGALVVAAAGLAGWVVWLRRASRPERERWMIGIALALTSLALGAASVSRLQASLESRGDGDLVESGVELDTAYQGYWRELELRAAGVARDLTAEPAALEEAPRAFALLERATRPARIEGLTLLLVGADGEAVAWSGRGLLREPSDTVSLSPGRFARQGHAAATAWVVQAVPGRSGGSGAKWIVAGESRPLAGAPPLIGPPRGTREREWRYADNDPGEGWLRIGDVERPQLLLGPRRGPSAEIRPRLAPLGPAALAVGLGLFGLAALRAPALGVFSGTVLRERAGFGDLALLLMGALAALGAGAGLPGGIVLLTVAAAGAALHSSRDLVRGPAMAFGSREAGLAAEARRALPLLAGTAIALLALRAPGGWPDLAESPAFEPAAAALRLALAAALYTALSYSRDLPGSPPSSAPLALAVLALALGGAFHDSGWIALPAIALGLLFAGRGIARAGLPPASTFVAMALVAIAGSAIAWQWGARTRLAKEIPDLLAPLAPPSPELLDGTERRLERHFRAFDLATVAPGAAPELDPADLAYTLWRESPLARLDAASALVVEPLDGVASSFSFGFPLDDLHQPDRSPARWEAMAPSAWRELERRGDGAIVAGGREQGRVRWYLAPLPGFGVRDAEIRDLPTTLLGAKRSSELAVGRALALPADTGVATVIYGPDGEIELSPWREGTPALALLRAQVVGGASLTRSPAGTARFSLLEVPGATLVLLAPRLAPLAALERAGSHFAGALFVVALLAAAAALLALPRATARDLLARTFRSYAKRLILVYSLLLLVPLVLLYALLSESLGQRVLEEQRLAAQAALSSAQRVLGEYVLSLDPGFGLDTAIDDDLLVWLSRVVGHEIHLYWNGQIYASSQRELFAAGFLPRRVPGEIWRGATWGGERLMTRTTRAGEARYVELYAPLLVPGVDPKASRLLLSMPLLAQQEAASAETARIRRRTLLATLGAFLLLAGIGVRLARSFTRPITDLVAGTRRIAAGAPALGVTPRVDELSALAEAIDQMARRIAEGRSQLVREKQLVEGIVDSVTSGVVGVDRSGRVLIANRVARKVLDVEPGEKLLDRLALRPDLAEVRQFVAAASASASPSAARALLTSREERDWSLVWVPLEGAGEPGALLVAEDVSEVLRAQRLDAWAAMARLIAHEIKNPLTPIRLSAEHLRDAWHRDRAHFENVFERCTTNILKQVDELREIASEFSVYSHIPKSERVPGDLVASLGEVVEGYGTAPPDGVEVRFDPAVPALPARFDPKLLGRAVRNLVENALRASTEGGRVRVTVAPDDTSVSAVIRVSDEGPGVPEEQLARIFEPYFSTHSGGTGLGLPIALRIAEEHGGTIRARNRPTGGLEVTITIPRE